MSTKATVAEVFGVWLESNRIFARTGQHPNAMDRANQARVETLSADEQVAFARLIARKVNGRGCSL